VNHLTIVESADGTATVCYDAQPIILLEPDKDPRDGEPKAWDVQGFLVADGTDTFTPAVALHRPIRLTQAEYLRTGFAK
jgi:hypothetical protein